MRELRATIGKQRVSFTGAGYRLVTEDDELDSQWFRSLLEEGLGLSSDGLHAEAMGRLQAALSWWRGPPLPELADVKWATPYLDRLREQKLACTTALLRCQLALGRAEEAVALAKAELAASPANEDLLALAMVALARSARQAEALDLYEKHLPSLGSRSLQPGPRLRAVERAVREQGPEVMSGPAPSPTTAKTPSCPRALERFLQADFVGRAKELGLFRTALANARSGGLVAMVVEGEAGAGKTALLARMAELASRTGASVLHGAAPQAASAPLIPIAQAMEDFLARQGRDGHVGRLHRERGYGSSALGRSC